MPDRDYEDSKIEDEWVSSTRKQVEAYLHDQNLRHGEIGEWPAWHIAPITSIWAIESLKNPGSVGWWVISGDHPTDYVSSDQIEHPRAALRAFCARWKELVQTMKLGVPHPSAHIGAPGDWHDLAERLTPRVEMIEKWAAGSSIWDYDESSSEFQGHDT